MNNIIVFGTSVTSKIATYYIEKWRLGHVCAYVVDTEFYNNTSYLDKPVISMDSLIEKYPPENHVAFAAVGYSNNNRNRAEKAALLQSMGYRLVSVVNPSVTASPLFRYGSNCLVMPDDTMILPEVMLGENVIISSNCFIGHDVSIGSNCWISAGAAIGGNTVIGNNCFIGMGAMISNGLRIGNNCVIGIGAIVKKSLKDNYSALAPNAKIIEDSRLSSAGFIN